MREYGVFNDEGLLEGGFWSEWSALQSLLNDYSEEENAAVHLVCPEHPDQIEDECEECEHE